MSLLRFCVLVMLIGLLPAGEVGYPVSWGDMTLPPQDLESSANPVIGVAAGSGHTLVLKSNGTVVGWGANSFGQANTPSGLIGVTAIAAGG